MKPPTESEIRIAADVLRRLPKGFLPYEIFIAVTSKVVTPTMELAPLKINDKGEVEIFMIRRPDDDLHWPGQWHMPGTVIRSTDKEGDFSTGIERILQEELGGVRIAKGPVYVGMKFLDIPRGRELDQMFYVEVEPGDELDGMGEFFSVDNLPSNTMRSQLGMIREITDAFLRDGLSK